MAMGECKNKQRKYYIIQIDYKHFQKGHGRLQLDNVYTCHGFLQILCKFEIFNSRTFFHNLFIERFVDKKFGNPWQLVINKIHETQKTIICNTRHVSLGGTRIEEQSLKPFGEPLDDKVGPKTKVYDS